MRQCRRWNLCRVLFLGAAFLFLVSCTLPLKDSPYQRIVRSTTPDRILNVRVVARFRESRYYRSAVSGRTPDVAKVRQVICEGLGSTRFRCLPENSANKKTDFVVILDYNIIRDPFIRDQVRFSPRKLRRGIFGDHDPASEEAFSFQWRFAVQHPGGEPVFQSQSHREEFDFWEFELKSLLTRYFSE